MNTDQTVLLVEHTPLYRGLLRRALQQPGRTVLIAVDVPSGLALLEHAEEPIDLVIADVAPGEDGDEVAAAFRERFPGIAVLLLSSGGIAPFEAPELGKPFTRVQLEQRIGEVAAVASARRRPVPQLA